MGGCGKISCCSAKQAKDQTFVDLSGRKTPRFASIIQQSKESFKVSFTEQTELQTPKEKMIVMSHYMNNDTAGWEDDQPTNDDTIKYDKQMSQQTSDPVSEEVHNMAASMHGGAMSSHMNASMFNKESSQSQQRIAIIDSDNVKQVAMNILDQSISNMNQETQCYSVHDKQREFLEWEAEFHREQRNNFLYWFQDHAQMCQPSAGGRDWNQNSKPSIDDIAEDPEKMSVLMDGVKWTIINEIGHPINSFDYIVAIESPTSVNIGCLLARQFDLPFTVIKTDQILPGDAIWQQYDTEEGPKTLSVRHDCIYPQSEILLIAHEMSNDNQLGAAENLLERIEGARVTGAFTVFKDRGVRSQMKIQCKFSCLINLDELDQL